MLRNTGNCKTFQAFIVLIIVLKNGPVCTKASLFSFKKIIWGVAKNAQFSSSSNCVAGISSTSLSDPGTGMKFEGFGGSTVVAGPDPSATEVCVSLAVHFNECRIRPLMKMHMAALKGQASIPISPAFQIYPA